MSKKLRPNVKQLNLKRSKRVQKAMQNRNVVIYTPGKKEGSGPKRVIRRAHL